MLINVAAYYEVIRPEFIGPNYFFLYRIFHLSARNSNLFSFRMNDAIQFRRSCHNFTYHSRLINRIYNQR